MKHFYIAGYCTSTGSSVWPKHKWEKTLLSILLLSRKKTNFLLIWKAQFSMWHLEWLEWVKNVRISIAIFVTKCWNVQIMSKTKTKIKKLKYLTNLCTECKRYWQRYWLTPPKNKQTKPKNMVQTGAEQWTGWAGLPLLGPGPPTHPSQDPLLL